MVPVLRYPPSSRSTLLSGTDSGGYRESAWLWLYLGTVLDLTTMNSTVHLIEDYEIVIAQSNWSSSNPEPSGFPFETLLRRTFCFHPDYYVCLYVDSVRNESRL